MWMDVNVRMNRFANAKIFRQLPACGSSRDFLERRFPDLLDAPTMRHNKDTAEGRAACSEVVSIQNAEHERVRNCVFTFSAEIYEQEDEVLARNKGETGHVADKNSFPRERFVREARVERCVQREHSLAEHAVD